MENILKSLILENRIVYSTSYVYFSLRVFADSREKEISTTPSTSVSEPIPVSRTFVNNETHASLPFSSRITTIEQLTACRGINSFELLNALYVGIKDYTNENRIGIGQALSLEDQVVLTLMKRKLNSSFVFLSECFNVDRTTCSRIFGNMVKILSVILENFITLPSRESLDDNIPNCFIDYASCRYVIDCTEVHAHQNALHVGRKCIVFTRNVIHQKY